MVYNGVYYEQLNINTSVILLGENKNTTIINVNKTDGNVSANEFKYRIFGDSRLMLDNWGNKL